MKTTPCPETHDFLISYFPESPIQGLIPGEAGFNSEPADVDVDVQRPEDLRGMYLAGRPGDALREQYEVITSIMCR